MTINKEQLAKDLANIAFAGLATALGGFAIPPEVAALGGAALGRLIDRMNLSNAEKSELESIKADFLKLAESSDLSDEEIEAQFNTAKHAIRDHGIGAARFAELRFDPEAAADEVARNSGWHHLQRGESGMRSLGHQCLELIYASHHSRNHHSPAIVQAFQREVLNGLGQLENLESELRLLVRQLAWAGLLYRPNSQLPNIESEIYLLNPQYQILPYTRRKEDEFLDDWLKKNEDGDTHSLRVATVTAHGGAGKTRWMIERLNHLDTSWKAGFLVREEAGELSPLAAYEALINVDGRILIVIDYVEDRLEQLARLLEAAEQRTRDPQCHIRLV